MIAFFAIALLIVLAVLIAALRSTVASDPRNPFHINK
jgi:hypothetical protein